jgi:SAM-dependent methyltransferase
LTTVSGGRIFAQPLRESEPMEAARASTGIRYTRAPLRAHESIPVFCEVGFEDKGFYSTAEFYHNSLAWLLATFETDEVSFRTEMLAKLAPAAGESVLVTSCGLGGEIVPLLKAVGPSGHVHAQDLSPVMVTASAQAVTGALGGIPDNLSLSISDAMHLPFWGRSFDKAFHFGGINEFADVRAAIAELNRVVRIGGRVLFSDEGVAPWLRETEYAAVAIKNNRLWATRAPLDMLPATASDVSLTWVLGNCFYVIAFSPAESAPVINIDVPHKGVRGGSMRTRYYGEIEGVTPETKAAVIAAAKASGQSVHSFIEQALSAAVADKP